MTENEERDAVVAEAMTWLRTPYHHRAAIKGVGADCAMFPIRVYESLDLIPPTDPGNYPQQWHLSRGEEIYLGHLQRLAQPVSSRDAIKRGDFGVWRFGRLFSHGAIILEPPMIIHACLFEGVTMDNIETHKDLLPGAREALFFRPKTWEPG